VKVVIADDYQNYARSLKCFTYLKDHDVTLYVEPAKSEKELIERFIKADVIVIDQSSNDEYAYKPSRD
jgi:hypothetical protein